LFVTHFIRSNPAIEINYEEYSPTRFILCDNLKEVPDFLGESIERATNIFSFSMEAPVPDIPDLETSPTDRQLSQLVSI
jgi:hypothetical protein